MPFEVKSYSIASSSSPLTEQPLERRDVQPDDVEISILYSGVCHSDIHVGHNDWHNAQYPIVPGHEIVGKVVKTGSDVSKFNVDDIVAVGVIVGSCGECKYCERSEEPNCKAGATETYNDAEPQFPGHRTAGGYSQKIVTNSRFVYHVPKLLQAPELISGVAPILCAGITTYSPLVRNNIGKGSKVAIAGLGGLGHMGVKLAHAVGAEVTVISRSHKKDAEAKALGAHHVVASTDPEEMKAVADEFDLIIDTIPFDHDINIYLPTVAPFGNLCIVGQIGPLSSGLDGSALIGGNRSVTGSCIGGIKETESLLKLCGEHKIVANHELITMDQINDAWERISQGLTQNRVVIETYKFK